ncbi:MAU2 chromatid cohesion factor homolog [Styela clava]
MNKVDPSANNSVGCTSYKTKNMNFNETTYQSLLVIAENYRLARPPRIRMCLQCLMAVFNINPPPQIKIRTHLQIATLLIRHTENKQLAQSHLHAAITLAKSTGNELAYFEAISLLATTLCEMSKPAQAKPILREGITASQHNVYWHARLLLQLAHLHHEEGDHTSTQQLLDVGADLASNCGSDYLKILFLLSKGMVLLVQQKLDEVNVVLSMCGQLIDGIKNATPMQVESHKVYFLTLQVAHLLSGGQVKSVKSSLKQLQQSIQEITALPSSSCSLVLQDNPGHLKELLEVEDMMKILTSTDAFSWLPRDHMCILVYLVTVTYSLLAGYLDKAQKYTEKALTQIRKLKASDSSSLLVQLELMFLEHMAQCHLIMCDKKIALQKITEGCRLCVTYPNTPSITKHTMQMHTLLGMYCMSMNYLDDAEKHLQIALKKSVSNEQVVMNMLNLAMVYMHNFQLNNGRIPQAKQQELMQILSQINPDSVALKSRNLKAASFFVKGMFSFFQAIYSDAKRFLRETLKMANAQDLNRLTACALVLLGHIYLSVGNHQESVNMVVPAMQLAMKIPDTSVKLWSSALLRDLYRLCGDEEKYTEYKKTHEKIATKIFNEQHAIGEQSQHEIIKWFSDDLPPVKLIDITDVTKETGSDNSSHVEPIPMDIGSSSSASWIPEENANSVAKTLSLESNAAIQEIKQSLQQDMPNALQANLNHDMITQNNLDRSTTIRPDINFDPNVYFQSNAKSDPLARKHEVTQKFSAPSNMISAAAHQSHPHQLVASRSGSLDSNLKQPDMHGNMFPNPMPENSNLAMSSRHLHNQTQSRVSMDNAMVGHRPPEQQISPFVQPHLSYGMNDILKSAQGIDSSAKSLGPDANPYLTATGQMQGLSGNFPNLVQQHSQLQALQQLQAAQANDLQHAYHRGNAAFFQQQNLNYPPGGKTQMPSSNHERHPQSWVTNQNHIYNINSSNYTWR